MQGDQLPIPSFRGCSLKACWSLAQAQPAPGHTHPGAIPYFETLHQRRASDEGPTSLDAPTPCGQAPASQFLLPDLDVRHIGDEVAPE